MNKRFFAAGLVVLGLGAVGLVPALADTSQGYTGPAGVVAGCPGPAFPLLSGTGTPEDTLVPPAAVGNPTIPATGVGASCFVIPANTGTVNVTINDASSTAPGATLQYNDANGNSITDQNGGTGGASAYAQSVCTPTDTRTPPPGAAQLFVFIDDPVTTNNTCGRIATGTTGTIDVKFTPIATP